MKRVLISIIVAAFPCLAATSDPVTARVREYRIANEPAITQELIAFLGIPNLASDAVAIEKNAQAIRQMFGKRGIDAHLLRLGTAPPLVVADLHAPGATRTIGFYAHYDGQPVDPSQWSNPPWQPVVRDGRVYARSASDDKAPIVAMLVALDAITASRITPGVNLKFVLEGEEEAGSPHLPAYLEKYAGDLRVDAWMLCDGPVHQSRKPLLYFGARGVIDVEVTVYGPARPLHSGHYGNWAPNPIVALTHLIDSMRDTDARILIEHFYDDVLPLSAVERDAIGRVASFDPSIRTELALGRTEGPSLNEQILKPALNLRGFAAGNVGEKASNSIPAEARASIDFRLVPNQSPERVQKLVEQHIEKQGFFIVRDRPDEATRLGHPNVVQMVWGTGYPAARTAMDSAIAKRVMTLSGPDTVILPSLGGSIPMYLFTRGGTPVIGVPIVNHDNNQHAANENLRLQNLWDGIELFARLFAGL
ncbi:MAG TPA: M20/M25/M40 family metallo-hydrolase [Thermoanaerobaculia bacterium]|nr:M20/M25/M40 family metallo-hydrolase [Thermoanaerobaculia bacterium]